MFTLNKSGHIARNKPDLEIKMKEEAKHDCSSPYWSSCFALAPNIIQDLVIDLASSGQLILACALLKVVILPVPLVFSIVLESKLQSCHVPFIVISSMFLRF